MSSESKAMPSDAVVSPKAAHFWHVDREMLRFKIHFFLFIGALSAAIPFTVVFAKARLGLAPTSMGAVLTAQMFLFVFTKPLIGYIADYFNRLKSIIVVLTLIIGSSYFCLLAIPKFEQLPSSAFNATSYHGSQNASTNVEPDANSSETRNTSDFQTMQFWIFAFLFSLASISANAAFTLSDTACCESIQKTGADFGRQRLWGSAGWGLVAPVAGFLNDSTGDFLDSWILMAAMLLLFLWNLSKLDLVKPNFSSNILGDVGTVLKSKEFLAYEVVIFMNGVSTGMIWFYLIWFLTSIGGSELLCGLCIAVQCFCGAIPLMFVSGWVIRRVGCFQILSGALLVYVIRFLWYSYLHDPWWVLPVECCHGITYGLYYTVLAHYGKKSSKPGTEATTQSVLFSTHEGLGAGLGCVLAGLGFDYFGGHETFFAASMFCACGFIISLVLFITVIRQKKTDEVIATTQPNV